MEIEKPWGSYEILLFDKNENYWIKRITIIGGQNTSFHSHEDRGEQLIFLRGMGQVNIESDCETARFRVKAFAQDPIHIHRRVKHKITNIVDNTDLVFLEIAYGESVSRSVQECRGKLIKEQDLIRYQDDYGRLFDKVEVLENPPKA